MVNNSNFIRGLTPRQAWDIYYIPNVQLFISDFFIDEDCDLSKTDYKKMCQLYVADIPEFYEAPFLQEDLDYIAELLEEYIRQYIKRIGGDDKLILLTEQEMDDIFEADVEEVILLLDYDRETIRQKRIGESKDYSL
ncbi:MAG: hypothetical protein GX461_08345, partial [Clostridiales bacterium]|nr:hypothetical protein [Clostridiales bacterium]